MTYEQKMKHMSDYANSIAFAEKRGEVRGIDIGRADERLQILGLFRQGYSLTEVENMLANEPMHR